MKARTGYLVPVVGPSGAGKDSLIRAAEQRFRSDPRFSFPRRVVTRKAQADAEEHDSLSEMAFALAVAAGDFAFWWEAHGNAYGIPASVMTDLAEGRTVVFNCSRSVLQEVQMKHPRVLVIEVTAPDHVLVDRIVARGRETREQALQRISRKASFQRMEARKVTIANDGPLAKAAAAFVAALESLQEPAPNPGRKPLHRHHENKDGNDSGRRLVVVEHLK